MKKTATQLNTDTWNKLFPIQDNPNAITNATNPDIGLCVESKIAGNVITANVT